MQAKAYMESIARMERELKVLYAKRRHYEELATSIGVTITGMPGGSDRTSSRTEAAAVGICDLVTELDVKMSAYTRQIRQAEQLIAMIPQVKFREVLSYRYLSGMSWRSISDQLGYKDEKSVFRCHGYALKALAKLDLPLLT